MRELARSSTDERSLFRQAVIDLCFERGWAAVTIEALCERAALDQDAFGRHFDGIEDCFIQVYTVEHERFRRQAREAREGLTSWRDRLRATAYALARFLAEDEKVTHFTLIEVRRGPEGTRAMIGAAIEEMFDLLDEGRQELADPESLSRATAESVGGGIFQQLFAAASDDGLVAEREIIPQMMYSAILPYLGPEAAREELDIPPPPREPRRL